MNESEIKDDVLSLIGKKSKVEIVEEENSSEEIEESIEETNNEVEEVVEEKVEETSEIDPEVVEEKPNDELELLKKQNELLLTQLNDVSNKLLAISAKGETQKEEESEDVDFLSGQDIEEILVDPGKLNAILNQVYKKAEASGYEKALRSIPQIVDKHINNQLTVKEKVDLFYKQNPALDPVRNYVAKVASSIQSEHPDWDIDTIFAETKKVAEYTLGIDTTTAKPKPKAKPAFVKGGNTPRRIISEEKSKQQKDIEKLMALR